MPSDMLHSIMLTPYFWRDANTIFDLCPLFHEHNWGTRQGLGVHELRRQEKHLDNF